MDVNEADAITEDEIAGNAPFATGSAGGTSWDAPPVLKKPRNAFTELMSPRSNSKPDANPPRSAVNPHPHRTKPDPHTGVSLNNLHGRDALGAYLVKPESFPSPQRVLRYNDKFVTIHDAYAKSTIHLLVMPRDMKIAALHPFDALQDKEFLQAIRDEVAAINKIVASELRRLFGKYSKADAARNEALSSVDLPDELPAGRDWEADVMVGVHAHPSMNHMHVHVLSRDRHSELLKHRKHYNSFSTEFFVPLDDFPMAAGDRRRRPDEARYLAQDMWNFGNKFKALKDHLEEEFDAWKKE
ncbi:MAG: hypothetical protein Q9159_005698 [Coniocarpon cinnabarinum]